IMNFKIQAFLWKVVLSIIANFGGFCSPECGFHIHIDKTQTSLDNVKALFQERCRHKLELVGLRELNRHCGDLENFRDKRCAAFIRDGTIEIRIFRCSLIYKNILRYLLFANDLSTMQTNILMHKYCQ